MLLPFNTALAGNYVNFGVFELYGDRALADALDIALKLALSIPLADILAFRKVHEPSFSNLLCESFVYISLVIFSFSFW